MLFVLTFSFYSAVSSFAHEYWLQPEKFFLKAGERVPVRLFVGDGLSKDVEERPFSKAKTLKFRVFSAYQSFDLRDLIKDQNLPVYLFEAKKKGGYVFAMHRDWSYITIEPDKFEEYLKEEGLEDIIEERKKLDESDKPGRERYSRYIKMMLQVGDKTDDVYKQDTGLLLEIIPLENPYLKRVGEWLEFAVLFEGKPLVNRSVFAIHEKIGKKKHVTDAQGRFRMKIEANGMWLIHTILMRRCECKDVDWESFWGSFSFGVR